MSPISRRQLLGTSAVALLLHSRAAHAALVKGGLPWRPGAGDPPTLARPGPWQFFTAQEAAAVEAFVDRLIPADQLSPGGMECGCAVFIDRQLAGPYGRLDGYYLSGPFEKGTKEQGEQSPVTPAEQYRKALAALDTACRARLDNKAFAGLNDAQRDEVIGGLEHGTFKLEGTDSQQFFKLILKDTQSGFLADPIYGGNRNMASWKMLGFPGTHYNYLEWIDRHNQRVTLPTVGIADHPNWSG